MDVLAIAAPQPDAAKALRRDQGVRKDAGVEGSWVTPAAVTREAAVDSAGAIRTHGLAIDPYRACLGLAAAAAARGATFHERSAVERIRAAPRHVEITTAAGTVRADAVIIATGAPFRDLIALRRHLAATSLYGVVTEPLPAAVRKQVGRREAAIETVAPPHRLVRWLPGDRAMVRGGRQDEVPARLRDKALVQRTGQLMYELSVLYPAISGLQPEWSWDSSDYETVDGFPLVGPHRNFPRHLFAFTPARHGAGVSWAAARILLRHYQEEGNRRDEAFGFGRVL
jgi:glycine/D-amino acid oxidase-like deaminating enzyme